MPALKEGGVRGVSASRLPAGSRPRLPEFQFHDRSQATRKTSTVNWSLIPKLAQKIESQTHRRARAAHDKKNIIVDREREAQATVSAICFQDGQNLSFGSSLKYKTKKKGIIY